MENTNGRDRRATTDANCPAAVTRAAAAMLAAAGLALAAPAASAQVYERFVVGDEGAEIGYDIDETEDGGSVTAGATDRTEAGDLDAHVVRYDSDGEVIWSTQFGDRGRDVAYSIQPTVDGDFVVAGESEDVEGAPAELFVVKLDGASGGIVWGFRYSGTAMTDTAHNPNPGPSIIETDEGGFVLTGNNNGTPTLTRLDRDGNLAWQWNYFDPAGQQEGLDIGFTDVKQDFSGDEPTFLVSGSVRGFAIEAVGEQDVYIQRVDQNGFILANSIYDFTPPDANAPIFDTGDGLDVARNGTIVVAGRTSFFNPEGGPNLTAQHAIRLDPSLAPVATTVFGQPESVNVTAYAAVRFSNESIGIAGSIDPPFGAATLTLLEPSLAITDFAAFAQGSRGEAAVPSRFTDCGWFQTGALQTDTTGTSDTYLIKTDDTAATDCSSRVEPQQIFVQVAQRQLAVEQFQEPIQFEWETVQSMREDEAPERCFRDECEPVVVQPCPPDQNLDGVLDIDDFSAFVTNFFSNNPLADVNMDGVLDIDDFSDFVSFFFNPSVFPGCP